MSSLLFLESRDFSLRSGDKGQVLYLTYQPRGLTLVLFYSTDCPYCDSLIVQFKQLPSHMNGCTFAMVNVGKYHSIVEMSQSTIIPLSYVPDIILFVNGYPYIRYEGNNDISSILNFLLEVNKNIKNLSFIENKNNQQQPSQYNQSQPPSQYNQSQQPSQYNQQQQLQIQQPSQQFIPEYTIGIPLYGERKKDKVCYLNFNSAYVKVN